MLTCLCAARGAPGMNRDLKKLVLAMDPGYAANWQLDLPGISRITKNLITLEIMTSGVWLWLGGDN